MSVHYTDNMVTLHHGDCLDVLAELADASVDAVVTDPPYGLEFMGKEWDKFDQRDKSANLMGRQSSHPFIASAINAYEAGKPFQHWCQAWATECLRVLKPGGHLLAFGGTRTSHRLACAIEDAGFEIRDSIAWLYGSGFPKSLDVSKAIDKRAKVNDETHRRIALVAEVIRTHREAKGMERATVSLAVVGTPSGACWNWEHQQLPSVEMWPVIKRTLDISDDFDGLIEGDRAQFIAAERAVIAQRSRPMLNSSMYGADAGGGFGEHFTDTAPATDAARQWQGWGTALKPAFEPVVVARKPLTGTVAGNVLAHGTGALNVDGCRLPLQDDESAAGLTARSGGVRGFADEYVGGTAKGSPPTDMSRGRWPANVVLDESQAAALDEMSGNVRSAGLFARGSVNSSDGPAAINIDREGYTSGLYADSGGASRFFYTAKADSGERVRVNGIAHPTVKPLALMRWLVRLVTPPGGVVLEPFAGSGTTVEACLLEGFRCIAVERETDYLPLITQRIHRRRDPVAAMRAVAEDLGLFGLITEEAE